MKDTNLQIYHSPLNKEAQESNKTRTNHRPGLTLVTLVPALPGIEGMRLWGSSSKI